MTQYAFGISYVGTQFYGWQRQNDVPTVQDHVERALARLNQQFTPVTAAGRTDRGVHATGQVAAFHSAREREPTEWRRALNALTPRSIHIDWLTEIDAAFHPRFGAASRRYIYLFQDKPSQSLFLEDQAWCCDTLDADAMHRAAQLLVGEHDFSAFRGAGCQSSTPMRRVDRCVVRRHGHVISMDITANAFLLHMVRNIARALHDVGKAGGGFDIPAHLATADRTKLGATACPQGLYLVGVEYAGYQLPNGSAPPLLDRIEGLD